MTHISLSIHPLTVIQNGLIILNREAVHVAEQVWQNEASFGYIHPGMILIDYITMIQFQLPEETYTGYCTSFHSHKQQQQQQQRQQQNMSLRSSQPCIFNLVKTIILNPIFDWVVFFNSQFFVVYIFQILVFIYICPSQDVQLAIFPILQIAVLSKEQCSLLQKLFSFMMSYLLIFFNWYMCFQCSSQMFSPEKSVQDHSTCSVQFMISAVYLAFW